MPPILLPQILAETKTQIRLPPAPAYPPTQADLARSVRLLQEVYQARQRNAATDDDVANVYKYQFALGSSLDEAEPPWFAHAMARELAPIRNSIDGLTADVATLTADVTVLTANVNALTANVTALTNSVQSLQASSARIHRIAAINSNRTRGAGRDSPLEIVPFVSGVDPTAGPHNLPPLTSIRLVRALNAASRDAYFLGYYPGEPLPPAAMRTSRILIALGVWDD